MVDKPKMAYRGRTLIIAVFAVFVNHVSKPKNYDYMNYNQNKNGGSFNEATIEAVWKKALQNKFKVAL